MKTLTEICNEHGSDKSSVHGYTEIYSKYFEPLRDKPIRLLEIGVLGGASLRTWTDYFHPASIIIGMDCDDKPELRKEGFIVLEGDATKANVWERLASVYAFPDKPNQFLDVLIDDARHSVYSIVQSFNFGFPLLKSGGIYCAEDIHHEFTDDARLDNHLLGLPKTVRTSDFFKGLIDEGVNENGLNQCGKIGSDKTRIKFITFYKSLIVIGKR